MCQALEPHALQAKRSEQGLTGVTGCDVRKPPEGAVMSVTAGWEGRLPGGGRFTLHGQETLSRQEKTVRRRGRLRTGVEWETTGCG